MKDGGRSADVEVSSPEQSPGQVSASSRVPGPVPSVTQGSEPWTASEPAKIHRPSARESRKSETVGHGPPAQPVTGAAWVRPPSAVQSSPVEARGAGREEKIHRSPSRWNSPIQPTLAGSSIAD